LIDNDVDDDSEMLCLLDDDEVELVQSELLEQREYDVLLVSLDYHIIMVLVDDRDDIVDVADDEIDELQKWLE
jgi:hypothetical protein